jgi:hypothetical protein
MAVAFTTAASNCGSTSLKFGGSNSSFPNQSQPGWLDLTVGVTQITTWPVPSAPTGLTATAGANGTTLSWSAPTTGPAVSFYRVYRDGSDYTDRYDTCGPECLSAGKFSYVDANNGGTTHTYYVTSVGAVSATNGTPTMAESVMTPGATG